MRASQILGWTIEEFCARYQNEDTHTEQVTALALRLFNALHSKLGMVATERRFLEAAGRLHDVGFSVDPARHREIGAELVRTHGLRGFSASEVAMVAGIMLLHSGEVRRVLEHPLLKNARSRRRILRLGSLLRIADGLDFSHLQDARITQIRVAKNGVEVIVASDLFPANRTRADRKADLWRRVWRREIRFSEPRQPTKPAKAFLAPGTPLPEPTPAPLPGGELSTGPFSQAPLLGGAGGGFRGSMREVFVSGYSLLEGARRLLGLQYKRLLVNCAGAVQGVEAGPLHDLRVANRRLRLLLQVFRKHLPADLVEEARAELSQLSRALGPASDLDVWIDFLGRESERLEDSEAAEGSDYLQTQIERRQAQQPVIRRTLEEPAFRALKQRFARLLRIDLPQQIRSGSKGSLEKLAATALDQALRQVRTHRHSRHSRSATKLHALRIRLRRARHLAEFFAPVLGLVLEKLARRLRKAEQRLGTIHDADVALERLRSSGESPPAALVKCLRKRRRRSLHDLEKPWKRLTNPTFLRRVGQALKAARRSG